MTLTKTEATLVEKMTKNRFNRVTVNRSVGRKPYTGGRVNAGKRDYDAAYNLVKKGVARFVKTHKSSFSGRGYTTLVTEYTIELV